METMEDAHHQHFHRVNIKSANNADCKIESDFQTLSLEHPFITLDKAIKTTFESPTKLGIVKHGLEAKCGSQEETIASLREENALQDAKIQILEQWIRIHRETTPNQDNDLESATQRSGETTSETEHCVHHGMMRGVRENALLRVRALVPRMMMSSSSTGKENSNSKILPTSMGPSFKKAKRVDIMVGGLNGYYTGPMRNGLPHGTGCIHFKNAGYTYLGEFAAGAMHGKGSISNCNKSSAGATPLRGCFEQNVFIGALHPRKYRDESDTRSKLRLLLS
jgi:hypothetical protein